MAKGGPTYADLLAALKKKSFLPVYLLHGEEDFLLESALHAVLDAVLPAACRYTAWPLARVAVTSTGVERSM